MAKAESDAPPRKRARREAMSRVDTAWLRMERPTNPMMITGVLMFAEPMSVDALKRVIKQRFLAYARFRQKAVDTAARTARCPRAVGCTSSDCIQSACPRSGWPMST